MEIGQEVVCIDDSNIDLAIAFVPELTRRYHVRDIFYFTIKGEAVAGILLKEIVNKKCVDRTGKTPYLFEPCFKASRFYFIPQKSLI